MLVAVVLVVELLAIFICVHRAYGIKLSVDRVSVLAYLIMLVIMGLVNILNLSSVFSFLCYIILVVYCYIRIKDRIVPIVVSVILSIIILTVVEFLSATLLALVPVRNMYVRDICGCLVTLLFSIVGLPILKINKLRVAICKRHWLMYVVLFFAVSVIFTILVLLKTNGGVQLSFFIFGVPSIAIILFLVIYWDKSLAKQKQMIQEMKTMETMNNNYDNLLFNVKANQHGLKNHMMAVMSSHYTYKTYEQLVEAQQIYCERIKEENKYNDLLLVGDHALSGFLYSKMLELEKEGIKISYKIKTMVKSSCVSMFYIIEMLGILLDNAKEAVLQDENLKRVDLEIKKNMDGYIFVVRNPYYEMRYEDIEEWFQMGKSTKGNERGIGLYRIKELCQNEECHITFRNRKKEEMNWIEFELWIKEKEDE